MANPHTHFQAVPANSLPVDCHPVTFYSETAFKHLIGRLDSLSAVDSQIGMICETGFVAHPVALASFSPFFRQTSSRWLH
jgi:hypothetical protein